MAGNDSKGGQDRGDRSVRIAVRRGAADGEDRALAEQQFAELAHEEVVRKEQAEREDLQGKSEAAPVGAVSGKGELGGTQRHKDHQRDLAPAQPSADTAEKTEAETDPSQGLSDGRPTDGAPMTAAGQPTAAPTHDLDGEPPAAKEPGQEAAPQNANTKPRETPQHDGADRAAQAVEPQRDDAQQQPSPVEAARRAEPVQTQTPSAIQATNPVPSETRPWKAGEASVATRSPQLGREQPRRVTAPPRAQRPVVEFGALTVSNAPTTPPVRVSEKTARRAAKKDARRLNRALARGKSVDDLVEGGPMHRVRETVTVAPVGVLGRQQPVRREIVRTNGIYTETITLERPNRLAGWRVTRRSLTENSRNNDVAVPRPRTSRSNANGSSRPTGKLTAATDKSTIGEQRAAAREEAYQGQKAREERAAREEATKARHAATTETTKQQAAGAVKDKPPAKNGQGAVTDKTGQEAASEIRPSTDKAEAKRPTTAQRMAAARARADARSRDDGGLSR